MATAILTAIVFMLLTLAGSFKLSAQSPAPQAATTRDSIVYLPGDTEYYLGVVGGISFIWNTTELAIFTQLGDCGNFEDGTSNGYFVGLTGDYVLMPDFLQLSGRILYSHRPVALQTECSNGLDVLYDDPDEINSELNYGSLLRRHTYDGDLDYLVVDVGGRVQPLADLPIYARLSFDAGVAVFGRTFEQYEEIVLPSTALYPDGTRRLFNGGGDIDNVNTSYGVSLGIGADLPFHPEWTLHPEVSFRYGLNSVVKGQEWKVNMLNLGLGIRWEAKEQIATRVPRSEPPPHEEEQVAALPPPLLLSSINTEPLSLRETVVTQTIPLLPYLFFDSAAADLRPRYQTRVSDKENFQEAELPRETLTTYYHLLHIIGSRMRARPDAELLITGTTDGRELADKEERLALARRRAEEVATFLRRNWNIENGRIKVDTRDIPALASSPEYPEGDEENRRVELFSSEPALLRPVIHSRFKEYVPLHSRQEFGVQVLQPGAAAEWELAMYHRQNLVQLREEENAPAAVLDMPLSRETMMRLGDHIGDSDSLRGELRITQKDGRVISAGCSFPIVKSRDRFEVSRLSLIVFDFDRFDIAQHNKEMMDRFVREAIRPASVASIAGSTDRLGEWNYNMELSESRAFAVRDYLREISPNVTISTVKGIGASALPYDNSLPEGRYYCRTVALEVLTPIE